MDGADRESSSSTAAIKASSTSKSSASDENNQSYHQEKGVNPPPPPTKHFMSPTIAAASKVIAPRKKILAERNEISDTRIQRTTKRDSKGTFSIPKMDNSDDSLSVNDDSSSRPCDFVTNCLSPRPKFLRYKPNRGREIILRCENEVKMKKERSSTGEGVSLDSDKDIETDLVSASQEGFVKQKNEQVDEREEGAEEEEEEREGFLRRVLKLLLVMVVLVLSTLYISSSNSPTTSSPTLQAMEGLKDGYVKIHDRFLNKINFKEIVKLLEGGNEYLDGNIGLVKINRTVIYKAVQEEEEMVEDAYMEKVQEISDNLSEVVVERPQGGEIEFEDEKGNEEEMVEDVYMGESVELPAGESEEVCDLETEKTGEAVDQMLESFELEETESVEKLEFLLQQEDEASMEADQENNAGGGADKAGEILNFEAEDNLKEGLIEHIESEIILKAVIGVTLLFAIVASLVKAFHLMRKITIKKDDSSLVVKPPCNNESGVEEKCRSVFPNEIEEHSNKQHRVDSFASPKSLINSSLIVPEELSQTRAPSIELLGEFVVAEMSSSFRSSGMKSRKKIESEVSSHSDIGGLRSKTDLNYSVPIHAQQQDFSEASAIHSQSYRYLTPEKKVSKKEVEGIDGEAKKVVTTPLRRSSRIRSHVTSP